MSELPKSIATRLADECGDQEYAHAYMEEHAISRIAAQIHAMRTQRGWTQKELARRAHVAQERISMIESADFESLTMKTLYKLARAFDVVTHISFQSFGEAILDVVSLKEERLRVDGREESLKNFCKGRIIKVGTDWKSIAHDHVTPVLQFSQKAPVDPTTSANWVRIGNGYH